MIVMCVNQTIFLISKHRLNVFKKKFNWKGEDSMKILKMEKPRRFITILISALMLIQLTAFVSNSIAWVPVPPTPATKLDVEVDVGSIHFNGETVEFYVLVALAGEPIDVDALNASLYYSGALFENVDASVEHVDTGLYRIPYIIPTDADSGTYALVVNATYCVFDGCTPRTFNGTALKSFLLSQTLTGWNALLTEIRDTVAVIKTDVGTIQISLENINATIIDVDEKIVTIETDIGIIKANIDIIGLTLTEIEGNITTINTSIGNIEGNITSIQGDIVTITTNIGQIQVNLNQMNSTLVEINGTIATIQTNIGNITTNVNNILLNITQIQGNNTEITTILGDLEGSILTIQEDVITINTNIGQMQVSLNQINAKLAEINGDVATIQTDIGTIETSINNINAKVTSIQGDTATISTALGDLNGTILEIQGDIATIKTDIGEIKVTLNEMNTKVEEGIDPTSVGIVLAAIAIIAVVTVGAFVLRRRKKGA